MSFIIFVVTVIVVAVALAYFITRKLPSLPFPSKDTTPEGECYICHKPELEEGALWCSRPHGSIWLDHTDTSQELEDDRGVWRGVGPDGHE